MRISARQFGASRVYRLNGLQRVGWRSFFATIRAIARPGIKAPSTIGNTVGGKTVTRHQDHLRTAEAPKMAIGLRCGVGASSVLLAVGADGEAAGHRRRG